jgi:hypothetical protein
LSVLREKGTALAEISRRLLDREVVDGDEVRQIVSAVPEKGVHAA